MTDPHVYLLTVIVCYHSLDADNQCLREMTDQPWAAALKYYDVHCVGRWHHILQCTYETELSISRHHIIHFIIYCYIDMPMNTHELFRRWAMKHSTYQRHTLSLKISVRLLQFHTYDIIAVNIMVACARSYEPQGPVVGSW